MDDTTVGLANLTRYFQARKFRSRAQASDTTLCSLTRRDDESSDLAIAARQRHRVFPPDGMWHRETCRRAVDSELIGERRQ